jgi:ElaB/YqjD/DUF883 family membrane-anchored ribosome-binding protein
MEFRLFDRGVAAPLGMFSQENYCLLMNTRAVAEKLDDLKTQATEKVRDLSELSDSYVREYTWTTLAVATVLGCVVGYLLANRGD